MNLTYTKRIQKKKNRDKEEQPNSQTHHICPLNKQEKYLLIFLVLKRKLRKNPYFN
ncbi:hypothetical protein Fmac_030285 [Flemingia macrophylla]|uniref:Uncharacterized protein n=1 Tax=Flemingia macrophylla TaxID=520843 RepID=A0ABD1LCW2_9FABA